MWVKRTLTGFNTINIFILINCEYIQYTQFIKMKIFSTMSLNSQVWYNVLVWDWGWWWWWCKTLDSTLSETEAFPKTIFWRQSRLLVLYSHSQSPIHPLSYARHAANSPIYVPLSSPCSHSHSYPVWNTTVCSDQYSFVSSLHIYM